MNVGSSLHEDCAKKKIHSVHVICSHYNRYIFLVLIKLLALTLATRWNTSTNRHVVDFIKLHRKLLYLSCSKRENIFFLPKMFQREKICCRGSHNAKHRSLCVKDTCCR